MNVTKQTILQIFVVIYLKAALASAGNDVFLQFYMNQVTLWEQENQQTKLQSAMLTGLKDYCSNRANFVTCGINSTSDVSFTASAVVISAGYPVDYKSRYLNVRVGIEYTVGSSRVRLPAAAVAEIAQKQRESVSTSVGYSLVYINAIFYSVPPPVLANKVIVPIFVLGTLVLIIVALALRHHQTKQHRKNLASASSEMHPRRKSEQSTRDNKVAASGADFKAGDLSTGQQKQQLQSDKVALDTEPGSDGKQKQQRHKKKSSKNKSNKSKSKSGKSAGAAIDWSGGGGGNNGAAGVAGSRNGTGEFNNVGFEKSLNEGDLRARQSGVSQQSASNLSEIIQVRSGAASPMQLGQKKQKTRKRTGDAEEDMLMDNSVFKPPEGNLTDDGEHRDGGASGSEVDEDDGVPTLKNSSDQQML